jgi:hypothetical protein
VLRRITASDGSLLKAPRTRRQQAEFERAQKRRKANAAAKARAWPRVRDIDPPAAELPDAPAVPPALPDPIPDSIRWLQDNPRAFGDPRHYGKLSRSAVEEIRRLHADGASFYRLGRQFGVSPQTIAAAVNGRSCPRPDAAELPEAKSPTASPPEPKHSRWEEPRSDHGKLCWQDVTEMRRLSSEGAKPKQLASQFRIHLSLVYRILKREVWRDTPPPALPR